MGTKQWLTSYPMLLKADGYKTGFAGKFGFSISDRQNVDIRGTDAEYQDYMRRYNRLIHGVDYSIGMIRAELEKLGIADNTVIIFSSDNGRYLGATRNPVRKKRNKLRGKMEAGTG